MRNKHQSEKYHIKGFHPVYDASKIAVKVFIIAKTILIVLRFADDKFSHNGYVSCRCVSPFVKCKPLIPELLTPIPIALSPSLDYFNSPVLFLRWSGLDIN